MQKVLICTLTAFAIVKDKITYYYRSTQSKESKAADKQHKREQITGYKDVHSMHLKNKQFPLTLNTSIFFKLKKESHATHVYNNSLQT